MPARKLGKTGVILPLVSMGVMNADNPELVKKSYELGIRHFDTAYGYMRGRNEEMLGKVFAELKCRDKIVIASKCLVPPERGRMSESTLKDEFIKRVEESLRRLRTDYIDIYYLHNVGTVEDVHHPGAVGAMEQLKKSGKVRCVGISTHSNMTDCLNEAVRTGFHDVILTAFNYAHARDSALIQALRNASSKGIGLIAMKTQCSQYWYKEDLPGDLQRYYEGSIIQTAVLKWVLNHDFITTAVPGYTTFAQMEEDVAAGSSPALTPEEKKFLEDRGVKLAMASYCRQCAECRTSCPKGVDIPVLMRVHMYAACYGNLGQARDTYEAIPKERSLEACAACEVCAGRCVNGIAISRRLENLKALFV